jgi:voltage-gated potassium channel
MRSFNLLQQALCSKVKEMFIALQCLVVVTLILSFGLYFYEHAVQPDVYDNVWVSIVWAFSQYIGNPGNFIDTPPISNGGYIIACLIGVLKIALFAVPAGLVGSSFAVAMSNALHEKEIERNAEKLKLAFESKLDRPTGFQIVPQHRSFCEIQTRLGLKQDEIIDVVSYSDNFRLFNLAVTQPIEEHPQDKLIVSHFPKNRSYGCCINRNSKVTIVSPSSLVDPAIGHFSYYLALIGGFNYISREVGELCPYNSYFKFENRETHSEHLAEYMNDLEELTAGENTWTFTTLVASGANEPNYPTKIHFSAGGSMDDFTETGLIIEEIQSFKAFYDDLADVLINKFDFESDYQKYHDDSSPCLFSRKFKEGRGCKNNIIVRFAWSVCLWDMRRIELARTIAEILTKHFIQEQSNISYDETLINKVVGFKI